MQDKVRVIANIRDKGIAEELEIPIEITANELITALNQIYALGMNTENIFQYYLKADNPKALLRGNKTLKEYGIRNGTEIRVWNS